MNKDIHDLSRWEKIKIIAYFTTLGMLWGGIEAYLFQFITKEDWKIYNEPFYHGLMTVFALLLVIFIPFLTKEKTDCLFAIGGGFYIQFLQDTGHWFFRIFVLQNWPWNGGFWTPYWDLLGIDFPIPLFWIWDICIAVIFFFLWWFFDPQYQPLPNIYKDLNEISDFFLIYDKVNFSNWPIRTKIRYYLKKPFNSDWK